MKTASSIQTLWLSLVISSTTHLQPNNVYADDNDADDVVYPMMLIRYEAVENYRIKLCSDYLVANSVVEMEVHDEPNKLEVDGKPFEIGGRRIFRTTQREEALKKVTPLELRQLKLEIKREKLCLERKQLNRRFKLEQQRKFKSSQEADDRKVRLEIRRLELEKENSRRTGGITTF